MNKLDNVDTEKRHRYEKVYAKLKDFEDYLIRLWAYRRMSGAVRLRMLGG